jgi:hypothetical protein
MERERAGQRLQADPRVELIHGFCRLEDVAVVLVRSLEAVVALDQDLHDGEQELKIVGGRIQVERVDRVIGLSGAYLEIGTFEN